MIFSIKVKDLDGANLEDCIKEFKNVKKEMSDINSVLTGVLQKKFHETFAHIFSLNSKIKAITWTQYAPYFNDGDECIFEVHILNVLSFLPKEKDSYYDEYVEEEGFTEEDFAVSSFESKKNKHFDADTYRAIKELNAFIQDDKKVLLMKEIFGADSYVLMTPEGIKVEPYEHH